ncbi:hypothetical protein EVAR_26645_1 [Eumeta japonica]|uniref:Uncharacterized protein n=1 Tax=Eumeta variegata TaxID=151549 RepID=A0A4C1VLP8_EUMVA|nr:hypothetical protein EVAR_26645_1 [Eumeta japonica]
MVVLEGGGALLEPALALDGATAASFERAYAQADVSLKLLPKRYINLHQWLSPIATTAVAGKDLKLQLYMKLDMEQVHDRSWCDCTAEVGFEAGGGAAARPIAPLHLRAFSVTRESAKC